MTAAVQAFAHVEAAPVAGGTRLVRLRSAPPLVLRRTGPTAVHLVGVGAGPVGGDDLRLAIRLADGARLRVTQVAAAVALPGPDGSPSRVRYDVALGNDADLRWDGEPTVAAAGCDHASELNVAAAPSSCLRWRDEVVCGRDGEPSGIVRSRITVLRGGNVILRTDTCVGDALWASPAVGGGARVLGSLLLLGAASERAAAVAGDHAAVLRPRDGLAIVTALGAAHPDVRAVLVSAGRGG